MNHCSLTRRTNAEFAEHAKDLGENLSAISAFSALIFVLLLAGGGLFNGSAYAQEPAAPQAVSASQLQAAIDQLGDLDYAKRTDASRTVRRTAPAQAVPALLAAVAEHADGFVRYRALVLLTGF